MNFKYFKMMLATLIVSVSLPLKTIAFNYNEHQLILKQSTNALMKARSNLIFPDKPLGVDAEIWDAY
ncbi:MAG: hypothetical protein M0R76_11250 [Proteobacteria bacterium]|nr:hypothetical protein [Pseudomonadota bacterium]